MNNSGYTYTFPAVRGVQAGKPCYIAMCPVRVIPKIFVYDEKEVPPELRAQRTLNKSRIPEIASYLINNEFDYTFSALTASINGKVEFKPLDNTGTAQNLGTLSIPMDAQILINDGQHRRAAIELAIKEKPELGYDSISVVFFIDEGLTRSQQMFADLNKHAVRPSSSISTLYDYRDPMSALARQLVEEVSVFSNMTEMEKSSISNRSVKLFTLSSIKNASKALLNKRKHDIFDDDEFLRASDFWNEVGNNMPDWGNAKRKKLTTSELREKYIHAHGVFLQAMGIIGASIIENYPNNWKKKLQILSKIDWARTNREWEGRAMIRGRISKARTNVTLTGNLIKKKLGIPLIQSEQLIEEEFERIRSN